MIALRYVPGVILLLAVALVPTVIHQYLGMEEDDGRRTAAVPQVLAGFQGRPAERRRAWGEATFGARDWFERIYEGQGKKVRLFVGRSYDQKRIYHHPEIALSRGIDLEPEKLEELGEGIPVHLMWEKDGRGVAAYVLLYDDRFIVDPVANQLRTALWQLFHPRRSITLFYVADRELPAGTPFEESAAARILREAIDRFREQQ
ncbi:MAG TPA: hypothetical protein ENJ98_05815 [Thiolapillus brandeum]|uniref:Methanolan biosynthesis EpsI domain-containing protein n=1 Tax=Thiolapillus brandeum TaxID=1076588 RepID=A0A7C5IZM2_9GAMM|nr:hypothetical protein [Thiolapillus brandeum]